MKSPANRLHHTAYTTKDMEKTRAFYEDVLGFPLIATWAESDVLFGKERTYCHCFFGLNDGGALAFFQFADPSDQAEFDPPTPSSPFRHIALHVDTAQQKDLEARIAKAGIKEPATYVLEHGYCRSVYVTDPNGLILEFTDDNPSAVEQTEALQASAHGILKNWLAGDHTSTNTYR